MANEQPAVSCKRGITQLCPDQQLNRRPCLAPLLHGSPKILVSLALIYVAYKNFLMLVTKAASCGFSNVNVNWRQIELLLLRPPYGNRAGHYIFVLWFHSFFFLSSFFLSSFFLSSFFFSRSLAALLHGTRHSSSGASAKLCGVEQRAPPIFSGAAIALGIGPHFSFPFILPA